VLSIVVAGGSRVFRVMLSVKRCTLMTQPPVETQLRDDAKALYTVLSAVHLRCPDIEPAARRMFVPALFTR
jgi:hypothetical protein